MVGIQGSTLSRKQHSERFQSMLHKPFSSRQCTYRYILTPQTSHGHFELNTNIPVAAFQMVYFSSKDAESMLACIVRSPLPQHNLGISFLRKRDKTQIPDNLHKRIHHSAHKARLSFPDCPYMFRTLLVCTDCTRTSLYSHRNIPLNDRYSDQLEHIPYNSTVLKRHIV